MKWKTFSILTIIGTVLLTRVALANVPVLTVTQTKQMFRMQEMRWLATLSAQQIDEVRSALRSGHGMVVEPALHNVVLHHLDDLLPTIEHKVSTPKSAIAWPFCKICIEILNLEGDPFEPLRQALTTDLPGDEFIPNCDKMDYCRLVRHMVTSLIVIEEVRQVRAGRKDQVDLRGLQLSQFEKELVRLNHFKTTDAIDSILKELSQAQVAGKRMYTLIQVLHTYPPETYIESVLVKLEQSIRTSGYGTSLLLNSLLDHTDKLNPASKTKLLSIIESIKQTDPHPSLLSKLSRLESKLR